MNIYYRNILTIFVALIALTALFSVSCMAKKEKVDIKTGDKAPTFSLPDEDGKDVALESFRGKKVVLLAFYPKDDSPICTKEMKEFRDARDEFEKRGVQIIGISVNSQKSHQDFKKKHELPFPLLSDEKKNVTKLYGVYNKMMGVSQRSYFLVDKDGVLRYKYIESQNISHRGNDELLKEVDKVLGTESRDEKKE